MDNDSTCTAGDDVTPGTCTLLCRNLKHCWFKTSTNSDSKSWSLYQAPPVTERSGCRLYSMYTFFLDACTAKVKGERGAAWSSGRRRRSDTHGHRFDGFNELLALQILQDLVYLGQREVALEADVSAPDPCRTTRRPHVTQTAADANAMLHAATRPRWIRLSS